MGKQHASSAPISSVRGAEARLRARPYVRAADLLHEVLPQSPEAMAALANPHIAFDEYGRILGISASVARTLGFDVRTLVGRRLVYRVLGPERGKLLQALSALRSTQRFQPTRVRFHRGRGAHIEVRLEQLARVEGPRGTLIVVCAPYFESQHEQEHAV